MEAEASEAAKVIPIVLTIVAILGVIGYLALSLWEGEVDEKGPTTGEDDRMEREIELIKKAQRGKK